MTMIEALGAQVQKVIDATATLRICEARTEAAHSASDEAERQLNRQKEELSRLIALEAAATHG